MVKLIKRVKTGSSTKQRLFPGHLAFQELCVVTQRAWRHNEHFQKLRDDWAIPVTRSFPTAPLRISAGEACFRLSTLIIDTFLASNQEPRSSSISGKISSHVFPVCFH